MNKNAPQKSNPSGRTERIFAMMLFLFIFLALTFVALLAIQKLAPSSDAEQEPTTSVTTTPSGDSNDPNPKPQNPIFANGVVPAYPTKTDSTVLLDAELKSANAVIVDVETGKILAGKNTDATFTPASMTKVMTLIVACEKLSQEELSKRLVLTSYYNYYDYQSEDLTTDLVWTVEGERDKYLNDEFLIKDLLYGIGVSSAADCTLMIADYTYGSMEAFVQAMNDKAAELHLTGTKFQDAIGADLPDNYTTAADMAVIMEYAMQIPLIREILSEDCHVYKGYYYRADGSLDDYTRYFNSHLFVSDSKYSRMKAYKTATGSSFVLSTVKNLMGKTGFLDESYLVCSATGKTSGKEYVVVVADTASYVDTMKDIKYLFDTYAT